MPLEDEGEEEEEKTKEDEEEEEKTAPDIHIDEIKTQTIAPDMTMSIISVELPGLGNVVLHVQQKAKFIGTLADTAVVEAMQMYPRARIQVWTELEDLGKRLGIFEGGPVTMAELSAAISFGDVLVRDTFVPKTAGLAPAASPSKPKADSGSYGVVFPVCLKERSEPGLHRPCASLSVSLGADGSSVRVPITLAMKLVIMPVSMQHDLSKDDGFSRVSRHGIYVGHQNPWREMVVARFASRLLRAGITPHVPLLYFPTGITDLPIERDPRTLGGVRVMAATLGLSGSEDKPKRPSQGVATFTEFSDLSFSALLDKLAFLKPTDYLRSSHELWYNAFMQLMQGLLALQINLLANHNDAHSGNIMASSTLDAHLYYAVPLEWNGTVHPKADAPVAYYRTKTNGFLWKWIDFGFTTSEGLFGENDTRIALEHAPSFFNPHAHRDGTQEATHVAAELYDVGRLVGSILQQTHASKVERQRVLDEGVIPSEVRSGFLPPESTRFFYSVAKAAKDLSHDADPGVLFRAGKPPTFAGLSRPADPSPSLSPSALRDRYTKQAERKGRLLTLFHMAFAESRMEEPPPKDAIVYDLRLLDTGSLNPFEQQVLSAEL